MHRIHRRTEAEIVDILDGPSVKPSPLPGTTWPDDCDGPPSAPSGQARDVCIAPVLNIGLIMKMHRSLFFEIRTKASVIPKQNLSEGGPLRV